MSAAKFELHLTLIQLLGRIIFQLCINLVPVGTYMYVLEGPQIKDLRGESSNASITLPALNSELPVAGGGMSNFGWLCTGSNFLWLPAPHDSPRCGNCLQCPQSTSPA